jgi:hypothetical protein
VYAGTPLILAAQNWGGIWSIVPIKAGNAALIAQGVGRAALDAMMSPKQSSVVVDVPHSTVKS